MTALLAAALSVLALAGYQPSPLLPLDGPYAMPGGGVASLAVADDSLLYTDLQTGRLRQLVQTTPGHFSFGPGYLVQQPVQGTAEVAGTTLTVNRSGEPAASGELVPLRREQVRFTNGKVTLRGKVTIPPGEGRHPAVVLIHGSEAADRDGMDLYVNLYASRGLVVLSYDKRGVGDSTGSYLESASTSNLTSLAGDAAAGFRLLARRADVDPARIGFSGGSQAGWIIPRAANLVQTARFAVIISGPAMSVAQEDAYSSLTDDGESVPQPGARAIAKAMAKVRPGGFDPRPDLKRLKIPVLWLFGAQDKSVWSPQSVRILKALHKPRFTIRTFAKADHFLLENPRGLTRDVPRSPRFTPALFPSIRAWLTAQQITS